jgi:hypothetical protein
MTGPVNPEIPQPLPDPDNPFYSLASDAFPQVLGRTGDGCQAAFGNARNLREAQEI